MVRIVQRTLVDVVDIDGLEPGTCDIVLVVDPTSSPAFTFVRVWERLKVPPSCAWARALELSTGPFPLFMLVPDCALPLAAAALPPAAMDEPVCPEADVEVPPVPSVVADVPPAAAEPPVPPVMLVCADSGEAAASSNATAEVAINVFICQSFLYGDDVEIVQPLTVMVLALVEPGPPAVEDELDTLPPPAWTCTDDPPAELELDSAPLDVVEPVVPDPDEEPSAVMLPSACFSTVTLQVSPDAVLPVFSIVAA